MGERYPAIETSQHPDDGALRRPPPAPSDTLTWRVMLDGALPGARNMARDHALALSPSPSSAVLRLYGWDRPTLSLGRNEPARDAYARERIQEIGLGVVRRPTGGRAVLHWRELTYAVVAPAAALGGPRAAYRWIHEKIAAALAAMGAAAEIAPAPSRAAPLSSGPCFAAPTGGEIMAQGRKLVGSAQLRIGDTLLQHGSILLDDDQARCDEVREGPTSRTERPATVSELLGREVAKEELEDAMLAAFGMDRTCATDPSPPSSLEAELEARYRSPEWTWRR